MSLSQIVGDLVHNIHWDSGSGILLLARPQVSIEDAFLTRTGDTPQAIENGMKKRGYLEESKMLPEQPFRFAESDPLYLLLLSYQLTKRHRALNPNEGHALRSWLSESLHAFFSDSWSSENEVRFLLLTPEAFTPKDFEWLAERISGRVTKTISLAGGAIARTREPLFGSYNFWRSFRNSIEVVPSGTLE